MHEHARCGDMVYVFSVDFDVVDGGSLAELAHTSDGAWAMDCIKYISVFQVACWHPGLVIRQPDWVDLRSNKLGSVGQRYSYSIIRVAGYESARDHVPVARWDRGAGRHRMDQCHPLYFQFDQVKRNTNAGFNAHRLNVFRRTKQFHIDSDTIGSQYGCSDETTLFLDRIFVVWIDLPKSRIFAEDSLTNTNRVNRNGLGFLSRRCYRIDWPRGLRMLDQVIQTNPSIPCNLSRWCSRL